MWTCPPVSPAAIRPVRAAVAALLLALVPLLLAPAAAAAGASCGGFAPTQATCTTSFITFTPPRGVRVDSLFADHCGPCVPATGVVAVTVDTIPLSNVPQTDAFECILAAGAPVTCRHLSGPGLTTGHITLSASIGLAAGAPAAGDWQAEIFF